MRADTADFGIAIKRQSLTAHGDQFTAGAHSVIHSHFTRSATKEAGECKGCKCDHLRRVCVGEPHNLNRWIRRREWHAQNHLEAHQSLPKQQVRHIWMIFSCEPYRFTG